MTASDIASMTAREGPPFVRFERRLKNNKTVVDVAIVYPLGAQGANVIHEIPGWWDLLQQQVRQQRIPAEWVERYRQRYEAFQQGQELPLDGTPIKSWNAISPALQTELERLRIHTVEQLAHLNDEGLRNIGMGGLDLKKKAIAWLSTQSGDRLSALEAENAEMRTALNQLLAQQARQTTPSIPFPLPTVIDDPVPCPS